MLRAAIIAILIALLPSHARGETTHCAFDRQQGQAGRWRTCPFNDIRLVGEGLKSVGFELWQLCYSSICAAAHYSACVAPRACPERYLDFASRDGTHAVELPHLVLGGREAVPPTVRAAIPVQ